MAKKVLIIYHSQTGNTEDMAKSVHQGAISVSGTEVTMKRAAEATVEDLLGCDSVAFGTPTNFGYMSGALKDFFDRTLMAWQEGGSEKPYAAFASSMRGKNTALEAISNVTSNFKLKELTEGVVSKGKPTPEVLEQCQELGRKLAQG